MSREQCERTYAGEDPPARAAWRLTSSHSASGPSTGSPRRAERNRPTGLPVVEFGSGSQTFWLCYAGMSGKFEQKLNRRDWLRRSLAAGGTLLIGFDRIGWLDVEAGQDNSPFRGGRKLGVVEFRESPVPMGKPFGVELDGRMFTDLSKLTPENPVTPTDEFYLRTRASELLPSPTGWSVRVGGLVQRPFELPVAQLAKMARPMGLHLMECAGNTRMAHFGMMSVAGTTGVPMTDILGETKPTSDAARVLISGFDHYATESRTSVPGASWIFTPEELESARAFLETEMNGQPLKRDHGAPLRLVVPGWYGCACIKWVNEITLVDDGAPATSQMQEYASRTMQTGVPQRVKDYRPAMIDQAAMPIRVEKWAVDGKIVYRVVGVSWGGTELVKVLEIRFNPEEDYVAVDHFRQRANDPWSFWTHAWRPKKTGRYLIRLRVKEPVVVARRLDAGFYVRSVEIMEV